MFVPGPVFPLFLLRDGIGHMPSSSLGQNYSVLATRKDGWVLDSNPTVQEQGEQVLWRSLRKAILHGPALVWAPYPFQSVMSLWKDPHRYTLTHLH